MNYFQYYPVTTYKFGEETIEEAFRNIGVYVDIDANVVSDTTFYNDYYIQEGERPDQVSYKLYGDPSYHWTFYAINEKIKKSGWPVSNVKLLSIVQLEFPNTVITTTNPITDIFKKGEVIREISSGKTGKVLHKNHDLGQIVFEGTVSFSSGETLEDENENQITMSGGVGKEYEVAHHYINSDKEWVDIVDTNGLVQSDPQATPVSLFDMYSETNDELKTIKVIKPSRILQITDAFKNALV